MSAVYSERWYRVASLKPRLSTQLQLRRQLLRGETWYLLAERGGGRSVRLNSAAYAIAGRFDGSRSVQELWDHLLGSGDDPPTQDEVIEILTQLREASLVQLDLPADAERLLPHLDSVARPKSRNSLLAWRIRLADPSALLDRLSGLQHVFFSPTAAVVWSLAVLMLLLLVLQHAPTLVAHGSEWLTTPRYATLALLLYVPVKLIHELAHGMAVRQWGGAVRDAGVTFMMGLPVPWIDASAATTFVRTRHRIAVGAAGMMAELALASVALPLWLVLPDGLLRDAMYVIVVIAGVSTLLFNANPLQRLDGYYIMSDALALPNLAPRSRQWWQDLLRRRLLRGPVGEPLAMARGEAPWLVAYAPLSWSYSLLIAAFAIMWLGHVSFTLGLFAGVLLTWQMVLRPPYMHLVTLRRAALAQQSTAQRWQRLALLGGVMLVVLLLVPLPQRTRVQGVVWPPDDAQLRAEEDGFVTELRVADSASVRPGEVVLQLANPGLQTRLASQLARVTALEAELVQALPGGTDVADATATSRAGDAQAELTNAQVELERLRERVTALTVRAQVGGRVALPQGADLPGRYLHRGTLFGQVLTGAPPTVRVAVPESDASDLQRELRAVDVRLATSVWQAHQARLVRDSAGAVLQLPSAALSERHGGPVATDPQDKNDLKALQPVVLLDLQLNPGPGSSVQARLGERVWVRFDAGFSPLIWQLVRGLQSLLLRQFNQQF